MPSGVPTVEEFRERAAARLAAKKSAQNSNVPAKGTSIVLTKQYTSLRRAINECAKSEEKRAVKMERATSHSQREMLETRFDAEREMDRRRILVMKDDIERLKSKIVEGNVSNEDLRSRFKQQIADAKLPPKLELGHNRFQGLETPVDIILYKANLNMFERHDAEFRRKLDASKPKFDIVHEQKRCALLEQKRQVLHQVIHIQQREIAEMERVQHDAANHVQSGRTQVNNIRNVTATFKHEWDTKQQQLQAWREKQGKGSHSYQSRPHSSNSSVSSSRASTASMATFASSTVLNAKPACASSVVRLVPPLQLSHSHK